MLKLLIETMKELYLDRYNIDLKDTCGNTPLMEALRNGNLECADFLVKSGVIKVQNMKRMTLNVFLKAQVKAHDSLDRSLAHIAAQCGRVESLAFVAKNDPSCDFNSVASFDGVTPLMLAARVCLSFEKILLLFYCMAYLRRAIRMQCRFYCQSAKLTKVSKIITVG